MFSKVLICFSKVIICFTMVFTGLDAVRFRQSSIFVGAVEAPSRKPMATPGGLPGGRGLFDPATSTAVVRFSSCALRHRALSEAGAVNRA